MRSEEYDAVIVGGGHNGLVAAAYLARAGLATLLLEQQPHTGGAAVSAQAFPGVDARLSRYSYLVSLLPDQVVTDLRLRLDLRSRTTASYTPVTRSGRNQGLLVESIEGTATRDSFRALTGSDREYDAWRSFYADVTALARVVSPTLTQPLPTASDLSQRCGAIWDEIAERPLGESIEARFADDDVRGIVLTDALIGTFATARDESLLQNRCFLYHLIGNGTGEWRVPVGGMGAVTDALADAAAGFGARLFTGARVTSIETDGRTAEVAYRRGEEEQTVRCRWVLSGAAPAVLDELLGVEDVNHPEGAQLKINLLVDHLPGLRSGADPQVVFAGTFHVGEGYQALQTAYDEAAAGALPHHPPGELYCHSLTDPSILGPELAAGGAHTLTYFGLHMPARLFTDDNDSVRAEAVARALRVIDEHLEEPLESCLLRDPQGLPCLEAKSPLDIEAAIGMPGGHIFHGDLAWPWLADRAEVDSAAAAWGVATTYPNVLLCGSGARRGGAVSGLGGHNAAMAVLASEGR
ncbi:MAG TPA: NAD(P)/FAD-dependent oxidoreductase [Nocardioidaceae bacterium]|nr:NAD(P)/FAD-dependent oxidoreductase [Nocardioidaceae bacterium]